MSDVNLIPAARLATRRRNARLFVWAAFCGACVMCLIASSATLHTLRATEDRSLHGKRTDLDHAIQQENEQLLALRRELANVGMSLQTTRAIHNQPDWSQLFRGLSDRLDDEIVLSRCELATLTGDRKSVLEQWGNTMPAKPLGALLNECHHTLTLSGFGKSQEAVSRFVLRLEGTGIFAIVRLMNSSRQSFLEEEAVAFSVACDFKES